MELSLYLTTLVSLFAIINPVGSIPVFLRLTSTFTDVERRRTIRIAVLVATGVLLAFALGGQVLFEFLGITLNAFLIAGGLLIGKYAFELIEGERPKGDSNDKEIRDAIERDSVAFTPLGMPLLAGPGAITTIMILTASTDVPAEHALIHAAIVTVFALSFLVLLSANRILRILGRSGVNLVARVMGLLLAAVAVQFVLRGLHGVAPDLFPEALPDGVEALPPALVHVGHGLFALIGGF